MTDLSQLAKSLTKAQREAVMDAEDMMSSHGGYPFLTVRHTGAPWPHPGMAEFLTLKTDRLTPLGLALRAHLKGQSDEG